METLNFDCLTYLLTWLRKEPELPVWRLVNRRWSSLIGKIIQQYRWIRLDKPIESPFPSFPLFPLSRLNLTIEPGILPPNCHQIKKLKTNHVFDFPLSLEHLDYYGDLPDLAHLTNLTSLRVEGSEVDDSEIEDLTQLRKLDGSSCSSLSGEVFSRLTNLTCLNLADTEVASFHLVGLTQLRSLNLNRSEVFDSRDLFALTALTKLFIHDVSVKVTAVSQLSQLTQLRTLHCRNNEPEINHALHAALSQLTNLTELDCSVCQSYPTCFLRLTRLQSLVVEGGYSLDFSAYHFPYLRVLDCEAQVEGELTGLTQLERLSVTTRQSSFSPNLLRGLTQLKEFSLLWTPNYTMIDPNVLLIDFSEVSQLEKLSLQYGIGRRRHVPVDQLNINIQSLTQLRHLSLSLVPTTPLDFSVFPRLQYLVLQGTKIDISQINLMK